jgi:RNA polymerase sigma-70 factor (ECF subfamily)
MNEELELLRSCIRGDKDAWDAFVERYSSLIHFHIHRCLRANAVPANREDVEDLYHSVFQALLEDDRRRLRQFEGRCSLGSWIQIITTRTVIDALRKRRAPTPLDAEDRDGLALHERICDPNPGVEEEIVDAQRRELLRKALMEISPEERLLAVLTYQREMPVEEIAEVMNLTKEAVYTRKHRLKDKLRKILQEGELL